MSAAKPSFPRLRRSHDLAQGLVGAWLLYEGSGTTANDIADQASNGAAGEGAYGTFNGALSWTGGQSGSCVNGFAGGATTNTYIDCGASSALNPTGAITLATWFNTTDLSSASQNIGWFIARDDGSTQRSFGFGLNFDGSLNLQINGAGTISTAEKPITTNKWWFVAATGSVAAGYLVYYGSQQASVELQVSVTTAAWTAPNSTTGSTLLGKRAGGGQTGFVGSMDSAFIWNRGLAFSEVARLFADSYVMARHRSWRLKGAAAAAPKWINEYNVTHPLSPLIV